LSFYKPTNVPILRYFHLSQQITTCKQLVSYKEISINAVIHQNGGEQSYPTTHKSLHIFRAAFIKVNIIKPFFNAGNELFKALRF